MSKAKALDEMIAAAEAAVKFMCSKSKHPLDEFEQTAMRLGNAADDLMRSVGGKQAEAYFNRMLAGLEAKIAKAQGKSPN